MAFQKKDGQFYAPEGKKLEKKLLRPFVFASVALDHGHIYGMTNGLMEAGARLKWVYDPDPVKVKAYKEKYPDVAVASSYEEILADEEVDLIAEAAIPSDRAEIAIKAMKAGKHCFSDKPGCTTLEQLEAIKVVQKETGMRWGVYFSERLHVEAAVRAGEIVRSGAIGNVIQVLVLAPHRAAVSTRPDWFFEKDKFGGIITDIGSHQIEQILYFTGSESAEIVSSHVANYAHGNYPTFEDFGDGSLKLPNGATGYFRVDWFTPDGLPAWGDGRLFILGTEGYIELRKYHDISTGVSDSVYWVDRKEVHHENVAGKVGYPFFGEFINDCISGTENAMKQDYIFTVMELSLKLEKDAEKLEGSGGRPGF